MTFYPGGSSSISISKLNKDLRTLKASTFIGGSSVENAPKILIDSSDNLILIASTGSPDYPTTEGTYQEDYIVSDGSYNIILSKLDNHLALLHESTFIGSTDSDVMGGLAVDSKGELFVAGTTMSAGFPTTPEAYDTSHNGNDDVFVLRMSGWAGEPLQVEELARPVPIEKTIDVSVSDDSSQPGEMITVGATLKGAAGGNEVELELTDFVGNSIIYDTAFTDATGHAIFQFEAPQESERSYTITVMAYLGDERLMDSTPFEVKPAKAQAEEEDVIPEDQDVVPEEEDVVQEREGGGCLIATAAYGSVLAPQIQQLIELRDNTLLQTSSGSAFMELFNQLYYSFSPIVADWERQNTLFREAVKITITPMIATLSILNYVDIDSDAEMLGFGIGIISINIGLYFVAPVLVIFRFLGYRKKIKLYQ